MIACLLFSAASALAVHAQTNPISGLYDYKLKIPAEIQQIQDEKIRSMAIAQVNAKNNQYAFYFNKALYGFSVASGAVSDGKFLVNGEWSTYIDTKSNSRLSQENLFDKMFTIKEDYLPLSWEIESETKEILGKQCVKATSRLGNMSIVAWFTSEIPVPIGPAGYMGLPGIIMELDTDYFLYSIKKVEFTDQELKIVPPKGKTVSRKEYIEIRDKKIRQQGGEVKQGVTVITM